MRRVFVVLSLLAGCAAPEVDLERSGLLACDLVADEPCEADGVCAAGRCYRPQEQPRVEILSPEVPAFARYEPGAGQIPVVLRVVSNADLQSDDEADAVGPLGALEVVVDGEIVDTIDGGDPSSGMDVPISLANTPGVHRISVQLLQPDGTPYDNDAARARLVYFVTEDDRAYVAITRPWPGDAIPGSTQQVAVEVQTFNFDIVPAGLRPLEDMGHVHLHYGDDVTSCWRERACDARAAAIVDRAEDNGVGTGIALFPSTGVEQTTLGAVLRNADHGPYLVPFAECSVLQPPASCDVITDTIEIRRTAEPSPQP